MGLDRRLTLSDIADLRAYERDREETRAAVIALKRLRRVPIGDIVTAVFENRETVRFQVQEMARAERMLRDEQIQRELDVYNSLIPEPGELSLTLFVELTSEGELREWLPKLVGIERSVRLYLGDEVLEAVPEAAHEAALTREEVTASVHYVRFSLDGWQVARFATEGLALGVDHPAYAHRSAISQPTRESLLGDLLPGAGSS